MRRVLWIVSALLVIGRPAFAEEPLNCYEFFTSHSSFQVGTSAYLEYVVETSRPGPPCPGWVVVEASVESVRGSAATSEGAFRAVVRKQVPVPQSGSYHIHGKHTRYIVARRDISYSQSETSMTIPEPDMDCSIYNGGGDYYVWDAREERCVPFLGSPIVVDTSRDGYRLTSVKNGVHFDVNADGRPERTAWTRRDSDDAFLAMDRNGNGRIDDGSELFGDHTPAYADRADVTAINGFEALAFLQTSSYGNSRPDRQIDGADAAFGRLLLWRDANHNGISEEEELTPLSAAGVRAIGTDYKETRRVDRFGNQFRQKGRIAWADGVVDVVFDVWLQRGQ